MIHIECITGNPFTENGYIVWDDKSREAALIDPGCYEKHEQNEWVHFLDTHQIKPVLLLNTHCHIDHILGNYFLGNQYGLPLRTSNGEWEVYEQNRIWGKMYGIECDPAPENIIIIDKNSKLAFGKYSFQIISAPGHSPDGICYYLPEANTLLAGDVIFQESIGRSDLPGGNSELLLQNIQNKIYSLPDETLIYPGHGPATKVGHEKIYNPFVRA